VFGLKMHFHRRAVVEDRRNPPNEELGEPIGIDVLLKERARFAG
jgi:hypothetical protein